MAATRGTGKRTLALALAGGAGFWLANFAISRTSLAAEYRAALSIPYGPMLLESLIGGLVIGLCVASLLRRLARKAPAKNPVRSAMLLSLVVLVIATVALGVPAALFTGTGDPVRYFFIGLLFNAVRILALGAVMGHLQAWLRRRPTVKKQAEVVVKPGRFMGAAGLVAALVAAALLGACTTTNVASNRTGWSEYATIATKDYVTVGMVRATSEETTKRSILGIVTSHTGSQITYDMLIGEAKALGADDIINVRIDRVDQTVHSTLPAIEWLIGFTETYSYTGTALAISYRDATATPRQATQAPGSGLGGGPE
jgi:uncharacterized protein YbjQ (UPF0145 family)